MYSCTVNGAVRIVATSVEFFELKFRFMVSVDLPVKGGTLI